jgi:ABC-type sugar transport system permease subunit
MGKKSFGARLRHFARRRELIAYAFILPWLAGIIVFVAYPIYRSVAFSRSQVRVTLQGLLLIPIGMENFTRVINDTAFMENIFGFAGRILLSIPVIIVFSMMVAIMLNTGIRTKGFFRVLFFLPVIISSGPVMAEFTNQQVATVPMIQEIGLEQLLTSLLPDAIAGPIATVFNEIIIILWFSGVQILIFLAGLQKVDSNLYEAASIDGASAWEKFWKITLPSLKNIIFVTAIYTLIALASFDNNPIINSIRNRMFDAVGGGYGYASAMAWVYAGVIFIMLIIIVIIFVDKNSEERLLRKYRRKERKAQRLNRKRDARIRGMGHGAVH